jgi:hypothetical protein
VGLGRGPHGRLPRGARGHEPGEPAQVKNMSGRIFGGFLMRRAFELAFATAYTFAGWRPQFVRCEEARSCALPAGCSGLQAAQACLPFIQSGYAGHVSSSCHPLPATL